MNVLIGCEYSGVMREAFRQRGHNAWSCDLLPSEDGSEFHLQNDVWIEIQNAVPPDNRADWDIIILHPECTKLCVSGNRHYGKGKPKHHERLEAIDYTKALFLHAKKNARVGVALENPVNVLPSHRMPCTQYIQPWQFGHGECKKTGWWLHRLPPLVPTNIVEGREQRIWKMPPSPDRWKERSRTYPGIAAACAEQWGGNHQQPTLWETRND